MTIKRVLPTACTNQFTQLTPTANQRLVIPPLAVDRACGRSNPHSSNASIEIEARHRLKPLQQCQLDGLCAVLSAQNALRLTLADHNPITSAKSKKLFASAIDYLRKKRGLDAAIVSGMGLHRRLALTRHLAKQVSTTNYQVVIERPDYTAWVIADVFDWVDLSLSLGRPVLISIEGSIQHYSVIAGTTANRLLLFDSAGLMFIRKRNCGLRHGYHQLPPQGLLRVAVYPSG